jgi:hypothetical protein
MTQLKLGVIEDDKPIKVSFEMTAAVHRDLVAYAEVLARETGRSVNDPSKLIGPMIERFMATDRGFAKMRRERSIKRTSATLPKLSKHAM